MPKSRFSTNQQAQTNSHSQPTVMVRYAMPSQIKQLPLISELEALLDDNERQLMGRFIQQKHQHTYLISHALKRLMLAERLDCHPGEIRFQATDKGKPFVSYPAAVEPKDKWHFNLSHTEDQVAVAVSQQPVGIDVENTTRALPDLDLAQRYFSGDEYERLAACEPDQRGLLFLKLWTLKEAYLKAEGWGLSARLDAFAFDVTGPISLTVLDPTGAPSRPWQYWQTALAPSFLLSLAFATSKPTEDAVIDCQSWCPQ